MHHLKALSAIVVVILLQCACVVSLPGNERQPGVHGERAEYDHDDHHGCQPERSTSTKSTSMTKTLSTMKSPSSSKPSSATSTSTTSKPYSTTKTLTSSQSHQTSSSYATRTSDTSTSSSTGKISTGSKTLTTSKSSSSVQTTITSSSTSGKCTIIKQWSDYTKIVGGQVASKLCSSILGPVPTATSTVTTFNTVTQNVIVTETLTLTVGSVTTFTYSTDAIPATVTTRIVSTVTLPEVTVTSVYGATPTVFPNIYNARRSERGQRNDTLVWDDVAGHAVGARDLLPEIFGPILTSACSCFLPPRPTSTAYTTVTVAVSQALDTTVTVSATVTSVVTVSAVASETQTVATVVISEVTTLAAKTVTTAVVAQCTGTIVGANAIATRDNDNVGYFHSMKDARGDASLRSCCNQCFSTKDCISYTFDETDWDGVGCYLWIATSKPPNPRGIPDNRCTYGYRWRCGLGSGFPTSKRYPGMCLADYNPTC